MSKKYFINNADSFVGKQLIKELIKEDEEETDNQIMVTYTDETIQERPKGIRKILRRNKPKLFRKKLLEDCDTYIYNLHDENQEDLIFGYETFKNAKPFEDQKTIILVSNVMVWTNTERKEKIITKEPEEGEEGEVEDGEKEKDENEEEKEEGEDEDDDKNKSKSQDDNNQSQLNQTEENAEEKKEDEGEEGENENQEEENKEEKQEENIEEVPKVYEAFKEDDYLQRVPSETYQHWKDIEDQFLSLQKENLKIVVICSGILYGEGEVVFHNHFKAAWLADPLKLPYLDEGLNKIPTIHIKDLAKFIIKVSDAPPENSYVFAIDNSQKRTQLEIIEAISKGVGTGQVESFVTHSFIPKTYEPILKVDLDLIPCPLLVNLEDPENPPDFEWHCEKGICENILKIQKEFNEIMKLRPMKICFQYPKFDKDIFQVNEVCEQISKHYRIPIITLDDIFDDIRKEESELSQDYQEELANIIIFLKQKQDILTIDEATKIYIRLLKWRLSQNDCRNRGYILQNFPNYLNESKYIFYTQKNKLLKRVKPKPKKKKKRRKQKKKSEEDQEQENQDELQNTEEQKEEGEGEEEKQNEDEENKENEEGEKEDSEKEEQEGSQNEEQERSSNQENKDEEGDQEQKDAEGEQNETEQQQDEEEQKSEKEEEVDDEDLNSSDFESYYEDEENKEKNEDDDDGEQNEEENKEEEEQEEDDEEFQSVKEEYFPESMINVKKIKKKHQDIQNVEKLQFFQNENSDVLYYDTRNKNLFEIFESLRIYIERNGRPFNYLENENLLIEENSKHYSEIDKKYQEEKVKKQQEEIEQSELNKNKRKEYALQQLDYILKNEIQENQTISFRNYIMQYIVPSLTEGLIEVTTMRPQDPIEFLAEYLYKQSFDL